MSRNLQPMLADNKIKIDANVLPQLRYPLFASPKLDGIRMRVDPVLGAVSRSHKPIPNRHLQMIIAQNPWLHHHDGELIVGSPTDKNAYNASQSAYMTQEGTPAINYHVFDYWGNFTVPYATRHLLLCDNIYNNHFIGKETDMAHIVPQYRCYTPEDVLKHEEKYVNAGYEGLILRSIDGHYKNGRSTFKEGLLLKFKRLEDAEARIIGFEQLLRNQNEQKPDNFGFAKRSAHKANMVPVDMVGSLIVETEEWGQFNIGSGLDDALRIEMWHSQQQYLGRQITFKYIPHGTKDKPRQPIFKGFRPGGI